jgi:hypothetical protein
MPAVLPVVFDSQMVVLGDYVHGKWCADIVSNDGQTGYAGNAVLAGIIRDATTALTTDRHAPINITVRNAKTNAWKIDTWISAVESASRPEGRSRPAFFVGLLSGTVDI